MKNILASSKHTGVHVSVDPITPGSHLEGVLGVGGGVHGVATSTFGVVYLPHYKQCISVRPTTRDNPDTYQGKQNMTYIICHASAPLMVAPVDIRVAKEINT